VCEINGAHWIHSPLLITSDLSGIDAAKRINAEYMRKKALAQQFLANIRFAPMAYLWLIEKPHRLDAFIEIQERLSDAQYWRSLEFVFSMVEYVQCNFAKWLRLLNSKRRYRPLMMDRKDRKHFETLPDTLTIYRGYQHGKNHNRMGLSWTLSKEKATWFAYRHAEDGAPNVAAANCRKADAFCYTNGRGEQEIIIDPAKLTGICVLRD
jgi:hypothetical protein